MSGVFLSFEGGEASGKSVQAKRLADRLRAEGRDVVAVREPGSTPVGERVRDIVLHAQDIPLAPNAQALLYSTARAQLVRDVIRPALAAGRIVIVDRFYDSTLAYQGYGHGADLDRLRAVTDFAVGDTRPDRTILLDLPVEAAEGRAASRKPGRAWDRFEAEASAFHQRVRDGYLALASAEPQRFAVIRADRDVEAVAADVWREVERFLPAPTLTPP
ncbi:MAG TPA: dTMP kinase [Candidatus Limnocylindria bacterium]|nr:dTMP kinase [Candidatus Limnocylindria bacterium]